jgi:hypothetical protein
LITDEKTDKVTVDVILNHQSVMWWSAFAGNKWCSDARDYDQAVKWARIECKTYKIMKQISVESTALAE